MKPIFVVLSLLVCGCAVQAGVRAGTARPSTGHGPVSWAGHFAGTIEAAAPFYGGVELEARSEERRGTVVTTGLTLGPTFHGLDNWIGFRAAFDLGMGLGWSGAEGGYLGGTLQLPIQTESAFPLVERNRNYRILSRRTLLVPLIRYRGYRMNWASRSFSWRHEFTAGISLRADFSTDLW